MRIAHLSDPHLLSLTGARLRDFLNKRWLGGLNLLANRAREHKSAVFVAMVEDINRLGIEQVLCTGDITNVALPGEFANARAMFDRFSRGPVDTTVIPGNHDAYVASGIEHFADHFADYFAADEAWRWPDGSVWPTVRVRGSVALIGISTSCPTPWFTAWGHIGDDQLDRLEEVLADPRLGELFRLVAIHHPPAGPPASHPRHGLRDREGFARVIARAGADLVLHGHEHRDLRAELDGPNGPVPVRGIQSATYAGEKDSLRGRYRVYTVEPGDGGAPMVVREELRGWRARTGGFESEAVSVGSATA